MRKLLIVLFYIGLITPGFSEDVSKGVRIEPVADPSGGRKIALLVGINDYEKLPELKSAKNDVELLRDCLLQIGFAKENVFCLVCGGASQQRPSRENIDRDLDKVLRRVREGDMLFIAMSGHGLELEKAQVRNAQLSDEMKNDPKSVQPRFCPIDANNASIEKILETTISIPEIYEKVQASKAKYKLLLIDACRSAPKKAPVGAARNAAGIRLSPIDSLPVPPEGIVLLQSCAPGQSSYEDPEFGHGVYTHYFVESLSGKASNPQNGIVNVRLYDLASHAATNTSERVEYLRKNKKIEDADAKQEPSFVSTGGTTNILLASFRVIEPPKPKPELKPGDRKVIPVKGVDYAFRWCPAGKFTMGSPTSELGRFDNEKQHQVTLTKGFWMLETQVTQEMWQSVMGENPSSFEDSKKLPVEMVSWNDCQEYIEKLNSLKVAPAGYKFSLPTEAQWEYACRAGTTTALNNGKNLTGAEWETVCPNLSEVGWYGRNSGSKTHEVGLKKANAWGLCDMHGNVWEWCLDWYGDYPGGSVTDPTGPTTGSSRVLRGGSWGSSAWYCRSASRNFNDPANRDVSFGVRPALVRD